MDNAQKEEAGDHRERRHYNTKFKDVEPKYISVKEASILSGIGVQTLRQMADKKEIPCYRTPSGHRKFDRSYISRMCNPSVDGNQISNLPKQNFLYARVSSKKQLDDLSRQIEYLRGQRPEYVAYTLVQDVASGVNFKRKGLWSILDACLQGTVGKVVVAHKDRLARFSVDLIRQFIEKAGGELVILNSDLQNKSSEQELADDLLSIVHIYSCKQMGRRKYKQCKQRMQKDQNPAH